MRRPASEYRAGRRRFAQRPELLGFCAGRLQLSHDGRWNGFATGILSYTGESHTNFRPNDPSNRRQGDYAIVNLRAGFEDDLWRFTLFVNNLIDARAQLFVNSLSGLDKTMINRRRTRLGPDRQPALLSDDLKGDTTFLTPYHQCPRARV